MILVYVILSVAIAFLWYYHKQDRVKEMLDKLPGPTTYPFLGNATDIICNDETLFKRIREWSKKYGPVYSLSFFNLAVANLTGPEEFELVASSTKNMKKGQLYRFLNRWLGRGLLTITGKNWKTHRKILTSAFHFGMLQDFVNVFYKQTENLISKLNEHGSMEINIIPLIAEFSLMCIAETSLGISLDSNNETDQEHMKCIFKIEKLFYHRVVRPWLYNDKIYKWTNIGKLEKHLLDSLQSFNNQILDMKSRKYKDYAFHARNTKKLGMLDLLLEAKYTTGDITDGEILDEINTFMFAGHDTISMSLCFTLMLLATYSDVQNRVYQEIVDLSDILYNQTSIQYLNSLKYMEMVIKESLRLYPSAPFIARVLEDDITTTQGYLLPKSTNVHIHIFDVHRNPKYWPDPDKFDPERFSPENSVNRHPYSYVPFSAGPRNCIGQKYAYLEMKAALYGILRNFIIQPIDSAETIVLIPDIVLRTKEERLLLKFLPRR